MKEPTSGTYADVYVVETRRIRVNFGKKAKTQFVLSRLQAGDYYDIVDDETLSYDAVKRVTWLDDDDEGSDAD